MFPRSVVLALILSTAIASLALDVPKLQGRVTDLAGLLETSQAAALENRLRDFESSDSTQIAVLVIPSLEGEALEDFTERTATAWRLGQKGRDNGALLLIALKDRKIRIESGYGLEATLTDARCRRIIESEITPRFREGDFLAGIDAGLTAIMQTVRGTYQPITRPVRRGSSRKSFDWIIFLLVPGLYFLSATGVWGGGFIGTGAGTYLAYLLFGVHALPMILGSILGCLAGVVLGAVVRSIPKRGGRSAGPFFFGGSGGSWGGGGFTGGFSGGGFSGGGGSFGGGGASGSW